jgi:hypothetical protein
MTAKKTEAKTIPMPNTATEAKPQIIESVRMNGERLNAAIQFVRETLADKPTSFNFFVSALQSAIIQEEAP